jgi:cell division protein FtsA
LESLTRAVNQAGYNLEDVFLSGIATSQAVFSQENKSGLNVLCDMGADITELLIFKDGLLKGFKILPVGGGSITAALSEGLKISQGLAEDVKRSYTSAGDYEYIAQDKEILIKKDKEYLPIKQRQATEISTSATKKVCEKIKLTLDEMVALTEIDNFVVAGRAVELEGFLEMLESALGISVHLAKISHPEITPFIRKEESLSGHKYLSYLTALGIMILAESKPQPWQSCGMPLQSKRRSVLGMINRAKEIYQEYF